MKELEGSFRILGNPAVMVYLLRGLAFTVVISAVAVVFGVVFGYILGIARNYCTKPQNRILGILATVYIEIFRNTPLLLWIFICLVFLPAPGIFKHEMLGLSSVESGLLFKGAMALILFESSVIAEIVRGGLNAIPKGQFEAAKSQGFSGFRTMTLIILPQVYKKIVPTLLGQVISTIKDSSYLANIAVIELMARTKQVLAIANRYNGTGQINVSDVFVLFGFAFAIYFIIDFILSLIVRKTASTGKVVMKPRKRIFGMKTAAAA